MFENGITRGRRRVGRTMQFQCNPGYLLQGQAFLTCMCVNGQAMWSNSFPICVNEGKLTTIDMLYSLYMHYTFLCSEFKI